MQDLSCEKVICDNFEAYRFLLKKGCYKIIFPNNQYWAIMPSLFYIGALIAISYDYNSNDTTMITYEIVEIDPHNGIAWVEKVK